MKRPVNFAERRAQNDETITPLLIAQHLVDWIRDHGDVESVAIVLKHKDGKIATACSTMNDLELIGLHATAQSLAIEKMDPEF